jgi:hypothetical protein
MIRDQRMMEKYASSSVVDDADKQDDDVGVVILLMHDGRALFVVDG